MTVSDHPVPQRGRKRLAGGPPSAGPTLIPSVLCAAGAAASIRGKGGSLPSATNDRRLLEVFGQFVYLPFLPRLIEWGLLLGERLRNKGRLKPKKTERGKKGGKISKINSQVDSLTGLPCSLARLRLPLESGSRPLGQRVPCWRAQLAGWLPFHLL